ncbi:MAG: hypothetical protein CL840_19725 [Crocinitomicaceae bacterium]|nr:hypothetical protein [Crocinitomicaceae bacterium]|tara:strand:- start:4899 stop:8396 length:3498 start_codon:yes stop_codon:yes gene_type:complete
MKNLAISLVFILAFLFGYSQTATWVKGIGTSADDKINDIAIDGSGNVYSAGQMGTGSVTIGSDILNNNGSGSANGILTKYNSSGVAQWGILFDNYMGGQVAAVEVDGSGNVYVVGEFTDSLQMNPKGTSNYIRTQSGYQGAKNFYVAKYNSSGILQWSNFMQSTGEWDARSLVLDGSRNVYVAGSGYGNLVNNNATDSAIDLTQGTEMPFLAKFTSSGAYEEVIIIRTAADNLGAKAYGIAIGDDGRLVICGSTEDSISFGSSKLVPDLTNSKPDVFVAKYNNQLQAVWGKIIGGEDDDEAFGIVTLDTSKILIVGSMQNSFSIGTDNLSSNGAKDILIAKLDSNGTPLGGFNIGGSGDDLARSIDAKNSSVWVTGIFTGSNVDFDPGTGSKTLNGGSSEEAFLANYNHVNASLIDAIAIGDAGSGTDQGFSLELAGSNDLYLGGYFGNNSSEFNPKGSSKKLSNSGNKDAFFGKYNTASCPVGNATTINGSNKLCLGSRRTYTTPAVTGATTYTWTITGDPQTIVSGQGTRTIVLEGLNTGGSTLEVTPGNGSCTGAKATLAINVSANPTFDNITPTNPTCGKGNGSVTISMNGAGPFDYSWSSGDTSTTADSLVSGTYYITVTNTTSTCSSDTFVTLNDNGAPQFDASTSVTNLTCNSSEDGSIDVTLTGGTKPYTINWSSGDTSEDITGLQAGGYRVIVMDSAGCSAEKIFIVTEPSKLSLSMAVSKTSACGMSNGDAEVTATGGAVGYTYAWSNSGSTKKISGLSAGAYLITVTDSKGCKDSTSADVNDTNGPTLSLDSTKTVTCKSNDGAIYITGNFGSALTYKWTDNSSNEDLIGVAAGVYSVTATGGTCKAVMTYKLNITPPMDNDICVLTVDDSSKKVICAFEKVQSTGIKGYNVYRESWAPGVYIRQGYVHPDSISFWVDPTADPLLKPYRYKLSVENDCGIHSNLSPYHQPIHLVVQKSDTTEANLTWTNYEGINYSKIYIDRFTDTSGWKTIDSVNFGITTYKDANPPVDITLSYAVGINHPVGCLATRANSKNFNSSRSNRAAPPGLAAIKDTTLPVDSTSIFETIGANKGVIVYPNPSHGELHMVFLTGGKFKVQVTSISGERIAAFNTDNLSANEGFRFDLIDVDPGVYFIGIRSTEGVNSPPIYKRIVIQ